MICNPPKSFFKKNIASVMADFLPIHSTYVTNYVTRKRKILHKQRPATDKLTSGHE